MHVRKQLTNVIDQIINEQSQSINIDTSTIIDDYKKLNERCDNIIGKIKARKNKK